MKWIIGIDGGGTKTAACAADLSGRVIARAAGGPANYHLTGLDGFSQLMAGVITDLVRFSGRDPKDLILVSLGLAGADRDGDRRQLAAVFEGLDLGCLCIINSDARIALAAGLGDRREGMVVIAGTGSIAYGQNRHGETFRAGGWGHLISDEGSGYDIGRQAVARGIKALEGRDKPSVLLDRIMEKLAVSDIAGVISFVYGAAGGKAGVAALAETVIAAAEGGDELACDILAAAAADLAGLAESVIVRGFPDERPVAVAGYGSLLLGSSFLRQSLAARLAGKAVLLPPGPDPVMGALKIGYDYLCGK